MFMTKWTVSVCMCECVCVGRGWSSVRVSDVEACLTSELLSYQSRISQTETQKLLCTEVRTTTFNSCHNFAVLMMNSLRFVL